MSPELYGPLFHSADWGLHLKGDLSPSDEAAVQIPLSWRNLLGFTSDRHSQGFRAAVDKLVAVADANAITLNGCIHFSIRWSCKFLTGEIDGTQIPHEPVGESNTVLAEFAQLLEASVPANIQLALYREIAGRINFERQISDTGILQTCARSGVSTMIYDFGPMSNVVEVAAGLAWSAISDLCVSLDCWTPVTSKALLNASFFLSAVICGRTLCTSMNHGNPARITSRAEIKSLQLWCDSVPDEVVAATCSAVSEMPPETKLILLELRSTNPQRWAWLVYAIYYRAWSGVEDTGFAESNLQVTKIKLTSADVAAIEAAVETSYPIAAYQHGLVYGFVDIRPGTSLWPRECQDAGSNALVASSQFRCRACYDPANCGFVDIIVPGYGICKTRVSGATQFTSDSIKPCVAKKRLCNSLALEFDSIERVGLLMDLLKVAFGFIRRLSISVDEEHDSQLIMDLSELAAVCPVLESLSTTNCTAVVSAHNSALCTWPIKDMAIWQTDTVADLVSLLRNPTLRMRRELVKLMVTPIGNRSFDEEERRGLLAYDGEFLSVTKEKMPYEAKAALISAVMRGPTGRHSTVESKAICHLDANILSLIFVFASTTAQRLVRCYE